MKSISAGLSAHFGGALTTLAVCLKMTRTDGGIIRATNHDTDLRVEEENNSPSTYFQYLSSAGGTDSDVQTSNALNVDTVDQRGILSSDSITEEDIHAGLYDFAAVSLFVVNWSDLSMGSYSLRDGHIGQVTLDRDTFLAQLQGMMEALKRSIGKLCNPLCPYNLGDLPFPAPYRGRCTKDLSGGSPGSPTIPYIVSGYLDGVSDDQLTLYDVARLEPGPTGGVDITDITNANPGVVTMASDLGLVDGQSVIMSGIVGPTILNTVTTVRNPSGVTFELPFDTSDTAQYPAYLYGGTVTPLSDSGWFDYGLCTITALGSPQSRNAGISREVKIYAPGQWILQQEFPYPLVGDESYTLTVGCNKTKEVCDAKFDNLDNFGGFPFVPGQDKIIQVAQPQGEQSSGKK